MIDLQKITPLMLNQDQDGVFLPFHKDIYLMQHTGLKVDGKDLYEGDIVATGQGVLDSDIGEYVIRWIDGDTGFFLTFPQECGWLCRLDQGEIEALDLKIIGNIYENKDLLK
jgi:uncharacterized phage protein (TIGR01671 family)